MCAARIPAERTIGRGDLPQAVHGGSRTSILRARAEADGSVVWQIDTTSTDEGVVAIG
jgi:hypothetical protein